VKEGKDRALKDCGAERRWLNKDSGSGDAESCLLLEYI
jgi:hypothetical protein